MNEDLQALSDIVKPKWCKINLHTLKNEFCCKCSNFGVWYQIGDGKQIHSLCHDCYRKEFHFCKGQKDFQEFCKKCWFESKEVKEQ